MKQKTTIMGLIAFLLLAMPFAIAQESATNDTFEVKGGKEYPVLQRALDRIRLAFTLQVERKAALIEKIEQRRQEHYEFLLAKGKTEQAERFGNKTIGLVRNFEEWKAKKNQTLSRFEERAVMKQNESTQRNKTGRTDDDMKKNVTRTKKPAMDDNDTNETD
jgi:hypothetical protein